MNVFIEGIPGSGKSTLLDKLQKNLTGYKFYKEGDISPLDLAWCSYMSDYQYKKALGEWPQFRTAIEVNSVQEEDNYIVAYTKIQGVNKDFYQYMEKFEIYGGRRDIKDFRALVFKRYSRYHNSNNVFECAFFQNIIEELMLYANYDDDEIIAFYREMISASKVKDYKIIRLISGNISESIQNIRKERINEQGEEVWYNLMMGYLRQSPYGKLHEFNEFSDMIKHFNRRIDLEKKVLEEVLPYSFIDVRSKAYQVEDLIRFINT